MSTSRWPISIVPSTSTDAVSVSSSSPASATRPPFSRPVAITTTSGSIPGRARADPPPPGSTGLYHFAINYPERRDLAAALKRLLDNGWGIDGASDHGTHEAIYLHDPDGNGIELAWDRDPALWRRNGEIIFDRKALDWAGLMAELDDTSPNEILAGLARYQ